MSTVILELNMEWQQESSWKQVTCFHFLSIYSWGLNLFKMMSTPNRDRISKGNTWSWIIREPRNLPFLAIGPTSSICHWNQHERTWTRGEGARGSSRRGSNVCWRAKSRSERCWSVVERAQAAANCIRCKWSSIKSQSSLRRCRIRSTSTWTGHDMALSGPFILAQMSATLSVWVLLVCVDLTHLRLNLALFFSKSQCISLSKTCL